MEKERVVELRKKQEFIKVLNDQEIEYLGMGRFD
jgi:hypothetical protein